MPIECIEVETDFKPLPDQEEVFNSEKRLNSVASTRRSGKTSGIIYYSNLAALHGEDVGIVMPDYTYAAEIYEVLAQVMAPVITYQNKGRFTIKVATGGRIRFYSFEAFEKLRGKKFHKLFIDEFQFFGDDINRLLAVVLPTTADYHGKTWFFGTPKKYTAIERVANMKGDMWGHYCMRATHNPYISPEEIQQQKDLLDPLVFAQEWEAQFVDFGGERWLYEFNMTEHTDENIPIDAYAPIMLCFDFNVDPCTVVFKQAIRDTRENGGGVNFFYEIVAPGGTRALCERIRRYIDTLTFYNGAFWVTGDASGAKRDTRGTQTDYEIIRDMLGIPFSRFVDTRKQNPQLGYSRDLCNTAFHNNIIFIDRKNCPILHADLMRARPQPGGDHPVKDRGDNKLDAFDAMRYGIHAEFKSIKDIVVFTNILNDVKSN